MGNAVRFRKPTRRKSPFKIFFTILLILAVLAFAGYFLYGYITDTFFSSPAEPEKPEIIYIIEEKDPPPPPVEEDPETAPVIDETLPEETPVVPETTDSAQSEEFINEVDN